ncbi:MAG: hypothetical protein ACUVUG_07550 [Candidatus Aminicenantia bacterium]
MVRVMFSWGVDLDEASNDVRERLDRILSRLPQDVQPRYFVSLTQPSFQCSFSVS